MILIHTPGMRLDDISTNALWSLYEFLCTKPE
jgi:hypothetical protein